jgi:hypothetical protein
VLDPVPVPVTWVLDPVPVPVTSTFDAGELNATSVNIKFAKDPLSVETPENTLSPIIQDTAILFSCTTT